MTPQKGNNCYDNSNSPNKPKKTRKDSYYVLLGSNSIVEFLNSWTTINAEGYCKTLRRLRRALQNERRRILISGVVLLHGNARINGIFLTIRHIALYCWIAVTERFLELKRRLGRQTFRTDYALWDTALWVIVNENEHYSNSTKITPLLGLQPETWFCALKTIWSP